MWNIHQSLNGILNDIKWIAKEKSSSQWFKYRWIDDMFNELHSLFKAHKVFVLPEVISMDREEKPTAKWWIVQYTILKVKFNFHAEDWTNVSCTTVWEAMDAWDKSCNKSMSIALKYALMQIFLIPTVDLVDPDAEWWEFISKEIKKPIAVESKIPLVQDKPVDGSNYLTKDQEQILTEYKKELDIDNDTYVLALSWTKKITSLKELKTRTRMDAWRFISSHIIPNIKNLESIKSQILSQLIK